MLFCYNVLFLAIRMMNPIARIRDKSLINSSFFGVCIFALDHVGFIINMHFAATKSDVLCSWATNGGKNLCLIKHF